MTNEREQTPEEQTLEHLRRFAQQQGFSDMEIGLIPDEKLPQGRIRITFFGEPHKLLEPGTPVEIRVADGSWQSGFRAIEGPASHEYYPGECVVWITSYEEWESAQAEDRPAARQPWPAAQMRAV
jgi:hypothetical protein